MLCERQKIHSVCGKVHIHLTLLWVLFACVMSSQAIPSAQVQIAPQDGGLLVTAPRYRARIGPDGNLHSLIVNGIEFLDDRVTRSAGASFFVDHPIVLPKLSQNDRSITATDETYSVRYDFGDDSFTLTLRHAGAKGAAYVVVCASQVGYVEQLGLPGLAATPADYAWPDVRVSTPTGAYLDLRGGTRIWGRALGRQVWELSSIAPQKDYSLTITPRQGAPRTLSLTQLTAMTPVWKASTGLVDAGTPAELQVRFDNNSNQAVTGEMLLHVENTTGALLSEEKKTFTCDPHQSATVPWTVTPATPDFYTTFCTATFNNGVTSRLVTTFGYDVGAIAPVAQRPVDFTEYWNRVVAEARAAEVKLSTIANPNRSTATVKVFSVGMEVDGTTFHGWLAVPKYAARYPGLLVLPGERIRTLSPNTALADCGVVVLSLEPTGQAVDAPLPAPLITAAYAHLNDPATVGLRGMMVRYLQAIHALASLPQVDPDRLAVTGVGLGGSMAMILGGLDQRIQAVAPDMPYFCHIELGRTSPLWPYREVAGYLREHPDQQDAVLQTLRYYDAANFVEMLTCPTFIGAGIDDTYSRPATIYGLANRLPGPHTVALYTGGHEGGGARRWSDKHWVEKMRWLTQVLGGPSPLPATAPAAAVVNQPEPTPETIPWVIDRKAGN